MPVQDVLEAGRGEEILLLQPQLLAGLGCIVRIEHPADALREDLVLHRMHVVAAVEGFEIDQIAALCRPEAERVDVPPAPADHGRVVGHGEHPLPTLPVMNAPTRSVALLADVAVQPHRVDRLGALEFPRIAEGEPVLGPLDLPAVVEALLEQAMLVPDAVAEGGDAKRRHAVEQAGREPAEATIAQGGIGLDLEHFLGIGAEGAHGLGGSFVQTQIAQRVCKEAADQEFQAEIVDPLAVIVVDGAGGRHPAVDEAIAHGEGQREEPVVPGSVLRVLADLIDQLAENGSAEAFRVDAQRSKAHGVLGHHVPQDRRPVPSPDIAKLPGVLRLARSGPRGPAGSSMIGAYPCR